MALTDGRQPLFGISVTPLAAEYPRVPSFEHGLRNLRLLEAVTESSQIGGAEVKIMSNDPDYRDMLPIHARLIAGTVASPSGRVKPIELSDVIRNAVDTVRPLVEPVVTRIMGIIRRHGATLSPAAQPFHDMLMARWSTIGHESVRAEP